ncbi:MAG: hypothetical protein ABIF77_03645 [bacterium]
MKYVIVILLALLIAVPAAAKEKPEKPLTPYPYPARAAESEPNNDCATANAATVGDPMEAAITPAGDLDYFEYTANAGDCVIFETHPGVGQTGGDTQMNLYADDCVTGLNYDDDGGAGLYSRFEHTFTADGTYYIAINEYGNNGEIGAYVLTADACPEPPPNATCETAIDLNVQGLDIFPTYTCGAGNTYSPTNSCTGYSQANGQDIVYKIYLTVGETFAAALTDEDYDAAMYLLTDCADMNSCVAGGDDPEEFSYVAEADGWYYLVVDGYCCDYCGNAIVTILNPIDTDAKTWGAMKSLYR